MRLDRENRKAYNKLVKKITSLENNGERSNPFFDAEGHRRILKALKAALKKIEETARKS